MRASVHIQNLTCGGSENTILKNLIFIKGITHVMVEVDDASVSFNYKTNDQLESVFQKLSELGYPVTSERNPMGKKAKSYVNGAIKSRGEEHIKD